MTLGKCYECCIVSLLSYRISGVFLSDLLFYNLYADSDAWDLLPMFYSFFIKLKSIRILSFTHLPM